MRVRIQLILLFSSVLGLFSGAYLLSRTSLLSLEGWRENVHSHSPHQDARDVAVNCPDPPCMGRLSKSDLKQYNRCVERMQNLAGTVKPKENGCSFMSNHSRLPVALISFPGSGNTWVRQLLEATTGICTGSTMCDMSLRFAGFTGESIRSGSVVVVKTHTSVPTWTNSQPALEDSNRFQSAIILIRNPLDAMVSEWSRRVANDFKIETIHLHTHTKEVGVLYFRKCVYRIHEV